MGRIRRIAPLLALSCLLLALPAAALASGCGVRGSSPDIYAAARSLVPPGSKVIAQRGEECVMFARSPSCVTIYFTPGRGSLHDLQRRIVRHAREQGWTAHVQVFPHGTMIFGRRRGFGGVVNIRPNARTSCGKLSFNECSKYVDGLQVTRGS